MLTPISVVIITFNEERNIERCIDSVRIIADEVIVVDSFSTDRTKEICEKMQIHFVSHPWEGYSGSKNKGNSLAKNDWILSLDADEALSESLIQSIQEWQQKAVNTPAKFNRLTNYCGKWVKNGGWYPDSKIRLFNRSSARWEGDIHETVSFDEESEILHLKGDCLHYSYYSVEQHYNQTEKFTTIQAKDLFLQGKKSPMYKLIFSPVVKFFRVYLFKLGFLDGKVGFTIARISAYATYLKYKKMRILTNQKTN
jgi:glycosyltransferase involved in cell wall biosynthesis